jgi:hypothetical protein
MLLVGGIIYAIMLFQYGIHIPFYFRIRGDSSQYLAVAEHFHSFYDALTYVGNRAPGFPFFEYLFYKNPPLDFEVLVNRICSTLFVIHEFVVIFLCWVLVRCRIFPKYSIYISILFFLLTTYPAMVLNLTTAMTDTFGADLVMLIFSFFALGESCVYKHVFIPIFLGILNGVLLGYAILVRPAYWPAITGFLSIYLILGFVKRILSTDDSARARFILAMSAAFGFFMILSPLLLRCKAIYGSFCVENPTTFPLLRHVKDGFVGARLLWFLYPAPLSHWPIVPDTFMIKFFYNRCPVTSVIGITEQSLSGCLLQHVGYSFIFFVKKWIGFFDSFRLTPFTEIMTPIWYVWLSRIYSNLAFFGLFVTLYQGLKSGYYFLVKRTPVSILYTAAWFFFMILLGTHSLLHVEERFVYPCIPFCLTALLFKIQELVKNKSSNRSNYFLMWTLVALLLTRIFMTQVLVWDSSIQLIDNNHFSIK